MKKTDLAIALQTIDTKQSSNGDVVRLLTEQEIDDVSGGEGKHYQAPMSEYKQGANAPTYWQGPFMDYRQGWTTPGAYEQEMVSAE